MIEKGKILFSSIVTNRPHVARIKALEKPPAFPLLKAETFRELLEQRQVEPFSVTESHDLHPAFFEAAELCCQGKGESHQQVVNLRVQIAEVDQTREIATGNLNPGRLQTSMEAVGPHLLQECGFGATACVVWVERTPPRARQRPELRGEEFAQAL